MGHNCDGVGSPGATAARGRIAPLFLVGVVVALSVVGAALAVTTTASAGEEPSGATAFAVESANGTASATGANAAVDDAPVTVRLDNTGGEQTTVTVILVRERVSRQDDLTVVEDASVVDRRRVIVGADATHRFAYEPEPAAEGQPTRLSAYLYRGDGPDVPSPGSAARTRQVWLEPLPAASIG